MSALTPDEQHGLDTGALAYPKCYGCGHNYFGAGLYPTVDGKAVDWGLCQWCAEEQQENA